MSSVTSFKPPSLKIANVQFDTDGDILLVLLSSEGIARFQVSSNALCLASPVFRVMVGTGGKFKESKDLQEKKSGEPPMEITLSDDNPSALAIILRIIHHQHGSVPKTLSELYLWQVAILVDKYDLLEAVTLWIDRWIQPYLDSTGLPLTSSSYFTGDKGVFLAYAFGKEIIFKSISKEIILTWMSPSDLQSPTWMSPSDLQLRPKDNLTQIAFDFVPQSIVGIYILFDFINFSLRNLRGTLSESKSKYKTDVQADWQIYSFIR